jgi:hypothetical protein
VQRGDLAGHFRERGRGWVDRRCGGPGVSPPSRKCCRKAEAIWHKSVWWCRPRHDRPPKWPKPSSLFICWRICPQGRVRGQHLHTARRLARLLPGRSGADHRWPSDREAVRNGHRREGQAGGSASASGRLAHLVPEAGLPAVPGAQAADKGFMRLECPEVLDAGQERPAFEEVPGGVLVTGGLRAIERVLDHRAPEQGRGQRVLAFDQPRRRIEQVIRNPVDWSGVAGASVLRRG